MGEESKPTEPVVSPVLDAEGRQAVQMQRVFIKFNNGKVAVFSGPAIFSSAELKLVRIQIADIVFSEPFEIMMKVPTQQEKPSEQPKS